MHPRIEDHVGAFEAHLRRVPRRHILHMDRRRDHGAWHAKPLGDVPFHLRAQHELRREFGHALFHREIVVADERFHPERGGEVANGPRVLARVRADSDHGEAEFVFRHAGGGHDMRGVTEYEHALAGEIRGVDRARIPWQ